MSLWEDMSPIAEAANELELKGKFVTSAAKISRLETNNNEHGVRNGSDSYMNAAADSFNSITSQQMVIIEMYLLCLVIKEKISN